MAFLSEAAVEYGEIRTLTTLRDTLLPKLLSGELSVVGIDANFSEPMS